MTESLEAVRYQWYTSYDRENEYDKNPDWAADLRVKELPEEGEDYENFVRFYDRFDPEHIWIKSDTTRDLITNR